MEAVAPIHKRSLDHRAADWIREAIATGNLAPGERLTEVDLAAQIGLSRSTVRAAMQRLASEGLLVQRPYAGWEVQSLTTEDAWELYTLRSAMEALAARLAAQRIDAAGAQALRSTLDELTAAIQAEDRRRIARADLQVHRTIVQLSGHKRLATQYAQVIDLALLYIVSTNMMVTAPRELIDDHRKLIDLIIAGQAEAAEKLALEHVSHSGDRLIEALEAARRQAG